jgi:hypothetical protein
MKKFLYFVGVFHLVARNNILILKTHYLYMEIYGSAWHVIQVQEPDYKKRLRGVTFDPSPYCKIYYAGRVSSQHHNKGTIHFRMRK